jgi:hypothetical protein
LGKNNVPVIHHLYGLSLSREKEFRKAKRGKTYFINVRYKLEINRTIKKEVSSNLFFLFMELTGIEPVTP